MTALFYPVLLSVFTLLSEIRAQEEFSEFCGTGLQSGACVSISKSTSAFLDAQSQCKKIGKNLVTIKTLKEQKWVIDKLKKVINSTGELWFGLYSTLGRYRWVSGEDVVPNVFLAPSQTLTFDACFALNAENDLYTWKSVPCDAKLNFICSSKAPPTKPQPVQQFGYCPLQFHYVNGACFRINPDLPKLSWSEAVQSCSKFHEGATLASIVSLEQQDYISVLLSNTSGPAWIGLSMFDNEHHWKRNDPITFTNWIPGHPQPGDKSLCTAMLHRPHHMGQWEDMNCSTALPFVCQAPVLRTQPVGPSVQLLTSGHCRKEYVEFAGRCYRVVQKKSSHLKTLPPDICPMRLAPHTPSEAAFMRVLLRNSTEIQPNLNEPQLAWIGLSLSYNTSSKIKLNFSVEDNITYVFPLSVYEKLVVSELLQPSHSSSFVYHKCAALSHNATDLHWSSCDNALPSICGYNLPGYNLHQTVQEKCPYDWIQLGKKCFSPVQNITVTWAEAESACLQKNSSLVSLHGASEHLFLGLYLRFNRVWLGMRVNQIPNKMNVFWSDHSPVNYVSFAAGQPSAALSGSAIESCVVLAQDTHDWHVVRCDDQYAYVCQLNLASSAVNTQSNFSRAAPQEYCSDTIKSRYCLEFFPSPVTFVHAQDMCRSRSKTLATILTEEHQEFLVNTLKKVHGVTKAYIGLMAVEGTLTWVSNYPSVPVAYWSNTPPNGTEQCVFVRADRLGLNTWDFGPCTDSLPFVCSSPVTVPLPSSIPFSLRACPEPYVHIGTGCYLVMASTSDEVTWNEASDKCAQIQPKGRLASIPSLKEQDGLSVLLASTVSIPAWIGLRSNGHSYRWRDSSWVNFTVWAPGYPTSGVDRCVVMDATSQTVGLWMDVPCSSKAGYICQTETIAPPETAKMAKIIRRLNQGSCVEGYYWYRERCYTLSKQSETRSRNASYLHDEVSGTCLSAALTVGINYTTHPHAWGTSICPSTATPHTNVDAAFMRLLLDVYGMGSTQAWIGLKLNSTTNSHTLISEDGSVLGASTMVAYESLPQAINSKKPTENLSCLVASTTDTRLRLVPCDTKGLPVLCSYVPDSKVRKTDPIVTSMTTCPVGWTLVSGQCYLPSSVGVRRSWLEAERACQEATKQILVVPGLTYIGHLASVHSAEQQNRLMNLVHATSTWIGLRILASSSNQSVHFMWSDASPMDYLSLSVEQLRNLQPQSSCLSMESDISTWIPTECYQHRTYICQLTTIRQSDSTRTETASSCNTKDFPLSIPSSNACFHVAAFSDSWTAAEAYCRNLNPEAHLASIHSGIEMQDIAALLDKHSLIQSETWFGLHENEFAYAWSDMTPVDFVSLSADLSKKNRHLSQDCFVLARDHNPAASPSYLWTAVNCSSRRSGVVCQLSSTKPAFSSTDNPPEWKQISCPPGYRPFANRCFTVLRQLLSWSDANQSCATAVPPSEFSGSLATIDNDLVQEFVASLLDDLPAKSSSAWIGLKRVASEFMPKTHWADHSRVQYLRPIYRSHQVNIYDNRTTQADNVAELCTSIFRSTYPRINGLWLQMPCDFSAQLPSVCQAIPLTQVHNRQSVPPSQGCPPDFYLGTTGFTPSTALSKPMCYRLLDANRKMTWEDTVLGCHRLTTREYNVTALSIASVFEASFLRAWLRMPRALGGCELPSDEPVWSGLRVTDRYPQCLYDWTWNSTEPVRFTDWFVPPTPSPSGCYVFQSNPYLPGDPMSIKGLGSLRRESACTTLHFGVCQSIARTDTESQTSGVQPKKTIVALRSRFTDADRLPSRPSCFKLDDSEHNAKQYLGKVAVSKSKKSCLRWDLVPANLTDYHLVSSLNRPQMSAALVVGSDGTPSYAENYCSIVYNATTKQSVYGCYTSLKPLQFEVCQLQTCQTAAPASSHWVLWIFLVLLLIGACVLGVSLWRGCTPLRLGYKRHFTPSSRNSRGMQRNPVHFTTSEELAPVYSIGLTTHGQPLSTSLPNGSDRGHLTSLSSQSEHGKLMHDRGHTSAQFARIAKLGGYPAAYHNPIYTALPEVAPEDDYDPEA